MLGGRLYPVALTALLGLALAAGCKSTQEPGLTHIPENNNGDTSGGDGGDGNTGGGNNGGNGGVGPGNTGGGNDTVVTNNDGGNGNNGGDDNTGDDRNRELGPRPGDYMEDREILAAQSVHFDYDSAAVRPTDQSKIGLVARYLSAQPTFHLVIEGHCDERGTEQYNLSLGQRRAEAVREALAPFGISPERIQTISYGENFPVLKSTDEVSYQENRRGEFVIWRPVPAAIQPPAGQSVIVP
ncbi:MAG: hypothetical protein CMO66_01695 [Verrucomicrobiales bacterium]|mgnify:CR=1 FL=1|nr:hypothetical protein [Verrucomicrobiales bacterium]